MSEEGRKRKVLIIAGALQTGGLENQLVQFGAGIENVELVYTSTAKAAYYEPQILEAGHRVAYVPDPAKAGLYAYCAAIYRLMKDERFDVIHAHELFHCGIEVFLGWLAGVKKRISHAHSSNDTRKSGLFALLYRYIMRVSIFLFSTDLLACSHNAGRFLYGNHAIRGRRFHILVNSVDLGRFFYVKSHSDNISFNFDPSLKYVIHVGRFANVKNHEYILKIARECKAAGTSLHFLLVGDGELFSHIREKTVEMGLDNISFLGNREDVPELLKKADLFILPSLFEGLPLSLIEAQTAGLPCLVSDTITKEADFSLGLVKYLSISDPPSIWAQELQQLIFIERPSQERIINAIHAKGFAIEDFRAKLMSIYFN